MKVGRKIISDACKERIRAMELYFDTKRAVREIAVMVGASKMTVHRWVKKYKWNQIYKESYERELSEIKNEADRLLYMCLHRPPKDTN